MADTLSGNIILSFLAQTWYVWAPLLLFIVFCNSWVRYVRIYFLSKMKWVLLEIKIPREVAKSPKAMESIFAGLHGSRRTGNLIERYWDGWLSAWFSFEIIGDERGVHFYIWTPDFFLRLIKSLVYSQYPTSEIEEVEDYTKVLPKTIPNKEWNIWGSEMVLAKPDAYPIKTYEDFTLENVSSKEEERKVDPLSALIEFLGHVREGEKFWLQIMIKPSTDSWKEEGEKLVAKLLGRKVQGKPSILSTIIGGINSVVLAILGVTSEKSQEKEESQFSMLRLSPGEQDIVKAIERNIAGIGFEVGIRWIYIARREVYNLLAVPAISGIFKQFASTSLNGFQSNHKVVTSVDYWFVKTRNAMRKTRLINAYRARSFFYHPYNKHKPFTFTSAELATIYHFPGMVAGSPSMERVESKKGAPPINLPI